MTGGNGWGMFLRVGSIPAVREEWVAPTLLRIAGLSSFGFPPRAGMEVDRMNNELLAVFEYMERERKLDRETLIQLVESALQVAGRKSIGPVRDLRVVIDRRTLDIRAFATIQVVDFVRNRQEEISLEVAQAKYPDKNYKIGDKFEVEVTPRNFGRIAAQTAKQAIIQKLRVAEKDKVYAMYKDHVGDIVTGTVRRFERSDVVVDLGDAEAIMPNKERVGSEDYQPGDRIRFLLLSLDTANGQGAQLVLSRSHPNFIRKLFELEVTEPTAISEHGATATFTAGENSSVVNTLRFFIEGSGLEAVQAEGNPNVIYLLNQVKGNNPLTVNAFTADGTGLTKNLTLSTKVLKVTIDGGELLVEEADTFPGHDTTAIGIAPDVTAPSKEKAVYDLLGRRLPKGIDSSRKSKGFTIYKSSNYKLILQR